MTASNEHDRELNEYLEGRHRLSSLYRAGDLPRPPELDMAILARAATARRRRPGWIPALSLAATVVLGVAVGLNLRNEGAMEPAVEASGRMSTRAPPAAAPAMAPPSAQHRTEAASAEAPPAAPAPVPERQALAEAERAQAEAAADAIASRAKAQEQRRERESFAARALMDQPRALMAEPAPTPPIISDDPQIRRLIDAVRELPEGRIRQDGEALAGAALAEEWTRRWHKLGHRCALASDFVEYCAVPGYENAVITTDQGSEPLGPVLHRWIRELEYPNQ